MEHEDPYREAVFARILIPCVHCGKYMIISVGTEEKNEKLEVRVKKEGA